MSYQIPSQETKDYELRKQINTLRNISLFQNSGINVDSSGVGIGSRDTPTSVARGTSTFDSVVHTLSKDVSNLYHATIQAGNIIIQDVTQGANILLHYIDQVGNSIYNTITQGIKGMWAFVKGIAGKVLTLVKATDLTGTKGNFYLDANISLNENQQVIMQWDATLGSKGMWVVAGGTPSIAAGNFANQQLSNLVGPTAVNVDLNLGNHSINQLNTLNFNSTGTQLFFSSSGNGQVLNLSVNGIFNVFTMSTTSQAAIFEVSTANGSSAPAFKTYNGPSPVANQILGTINFDGTVNAVRGSYVTLAAMVASNGTSAKLAMKLIESPLSSPFTLFSIDGSSNTVECVGSKFTIDSTANDPIPNGLPLTIDTLGSFVSYANSGGHLFQNLAKTTLYFGAFKPNVFYQGIQMVTKVNSGGSYTVDSAFGAGSDLIITMFDNSFTRNVTLPDANQYSGRFLIIKNIGAKSVFLNTVGGQTVDGQASGAYTLLGGSFGSAILFASGGQWYVAGKV